MNHKDLKSSLDNGKEGVGSDSKYSKRNSGLFSFFKWLKPTGSVSKESLNSNKTDNSSSCESLSSVQSSRTVASFSYVDPSEYSNNLTLKNIPQSPETDTYKARIKQRDHRREKDKDLTLRKKYNLFFNTDISPVNVLNTKKNTKSLPLMTKPHLKTEYQEEGFHRRTNSDSSKVKKAGAYLHVKGKRRAPQPPSNIELNSTTTLKRTIKRLAPPPPDSNFNSSEFSSIQAHEVFSPSIFDQTEKTSDVINNKTSQSQTKVVENKEKTLRENMDRETQNSSSQNPLVNKSQDPIEKSQLLAEYPITENTGNMKNNLHYSASNIFESTSNSDILSNDSLKLDHGILKSVKDEEQNIYSECSPFCSKKSAGDSKPWYRRQESTANLKREFFRTSNENKYEPIESLPEVSFNRNTTQGFSSNNLKDTKKEEKPEKKSDEKRKSGVSLLANISELDREAAKILQKEKLKRLDQFEEMPEFMKPKIENNKTNTDSWVSPKKRSARDLIAKFNAITNVTKATVNTTFFGSTQKKEFFGKSSPTGKKKQESLLESHKKRLEIIDNKINIDKKKSFSPLMKTESASAIKNSDSPKNERSNWNCPKCFVQNEYWRIICHVCSSIKPYFDDLSENPNLRKSDKIFMKEIKNNNQNERVLERSKTQIGFSALSSLNSGSKINREICASSSSEITKTVQDKKEEREKLKKMLIEMKNSLPKKTTRNKFSDSQKIAADKRELDEKNIRTEVSIDTESSDTDNGEIEDTCTEKSVGLEAEERNKNKNEKQKAFIMIGMKETIHENIEVKRTSDPKPIKVSSSVQTTSIMPKITEPSKKVNVASMLKKKNSFEPMKVQDFEDICDKDGNSVSRIYANLVQDDELSLFFNIPKNLTEAKNTLSKIKFQNKNKDTIQISRLLRKLEVAIAKGELNQAADYAKELAQLRVSCSVIRQTRNSEGKKIDERTFSVDMYVEDKVSHRGPFPIQVRSEQTVGELKKLVEEEFEIPANVQRWILGKELATDDNTTLQDNNITDGCPIFLYLVAPDSTSKENQEKKIDRPSTSCGNLKIESHPHDIEGTNFRRNESEERNKQQCLQDEINESRLGDSSELSGAFEKTDGPKIINIIPKGPDSILQNGANSMSISSQNMKTVEVASPDVHKKKFHFTEVVPKTVPTTSSISDSRNNSQDSDDYDVKTLKPTRLNKEWECHLCTLLNPMNINICGVCATVRKIPPIKGDSENVHPTPSASHQISSNGETYLQLMNLDNEDIVHNTEAFECVICFSDVRPNEGVTLRECLHQFCKDCVRYTIEFSEEAEIRCPYRDNQYSCNIALQDREIKALVSKAVYDQHLAKSVSQAENKIDKSFHCKTPDCGGWCIFEDNVNEFRCPVCSRINCLTCQAIHMGLNCKQYQQRMTEESERDENAKQTLQMLDKMVKNGEALECPTCNVIMMKKWGCDWLRCSMCKTEICWVTKGPRWGPKGKGDTSGGCQCGVNGVKCHPKCNYCH